MRFEEVDQTLLGPRSREVWEKEKRHITTGVSPGVHLTPIVFQKGKGSLLWDVDGQRYIDFAAGCFTNMIGHCYPKLVDKMRSQVEKLWHVYDFPVPDRHKLLDLLAEITPEEIDTFELYSGGAETVEAAMRAAASFTGNYEFIAFYGAFHGKTMGARCLAQKKEWGYGPVLNAIRVPYPDCYRCPFDLHCPACDMRCTQFLEQALRYDGWGKPAAIVFEPIQAFEHLVIPPDGFWNRVIEMCRAENILTIADEVLVGIGKTGKMFAVEHWGVKPDLIVFGKALGSGFPVMALGGRKEVMTAQPYGRPYGASTTFGFNALAVCAALNTLQIIMEENMLYNVLQLEKEFERHLSEMQKRHPLIDRVQGKGVFWSVELVKNNETKELAEEEGIELYKECIRNGLFLRNPSPIVKFLPALNTPLELLREGLNIFDKSLDTVEQKFRHK